MKLLAILLIIFCCSLAFASGYLVSNFQSNEQNQCQEKPQTEALPDVTTTFENLTYTPNDSFEINPKIFIDVWQLTPRDYFVEIEYHWNFSSLIYLSIDSINISCENPHYKLFFLTSKPILPARINENQLLAWFVLSKID